SFSIIVAVIVPGLLTRAQATSPVLVPLQLTPLGSSNGFAGATASALVDKAGGWLTITLKLPDGYKIPDKTIFEGWITDAGAITAPANSAADLDTKYGPRYGNRTIATLFDAIPYWLTAGALGTDGKGNLTTAMKGPHYN